MSAVALRWTIKNYAMQTIRKPLVSLKYFLSRIRLLGIHLLDAASDLFRYLQGSNAFQYKQDRQSLQVLIFFNYHKIEKSLSLPEVKPLFGLGYIETLLNLLDQWIALTRDCDAVAFRGALGALVQYRRKVGDPLSRQRPEILARIDRLLAAYPLDGSGANSGGVVTLSCQDVLPVISQDEFAAFVNQRHSVRMFSSRPIIDETITAAVKLAQHSPSVCNRQSARVRVFSSSADKAKVLECQNGNSGFGHLADRVLLVTSDLRAFLSSGERHQAYTDSGLFAMTLIYALHAQGVASCCLNLSQSFKEERKLRRVCALSKSEVPIMLIAIGYPPEHFPVALSSRLATDSILSFQAIK